MEMLQSYFLSLRDHCFSAAITSATTEADKRILLHSRIRFSRTNFRLYQESRGEIKNALSQADSTTYKPTKSGKNQPSTSRVTRSGRSFGANTGEQWHERVDSGAKRSKSTTFHKKPRISTNTTPKPAPRYPPVSRTSQGRVSNIWTSGEVESGKVTTVGAFPNILSNAGSDGVPQGPPPAQEAEADSQLLNQGSETSIFGDKSFLHRPADDVGDRSSYSVGDMAVEQTMQERSRSSTRILVDPAPKPHIGANLRAHVSENGTSDHQTSCFTSSQGVPTAVATSRHPMTSESHPSLSSGTSGGSVMPIRAGDQHRKFSLPEDQGGLKGGSQWHESVSFSRGQNSQTTGTMTATNSGIGVGYMENTSTNLQSQQTSIAVKPTTMPYLTNNGENAPISSEIANQLTYQGGMDECLPPPIESGTLATLDTSQTRSTHAGDRHVKAPAQGDPKCGHKGDSDDIDVSDSSDENGCKRWDCPCDPDYSFGNYCCDECRNGKPCTSHVHTPEVILEIRRARRASQKADRKRGNELREYTALRDKLGTCLDECDRLLSMYPGFVGHGRSAQSAHTIRDLDEDYWPSQHLPSDVDGCVASVVGDPVTFEEIVDELTTKLLKSPLGGAKHQLLFSERYDWLDEKEFFNTPPTKYRLRSIIESIGWKIPVPRTHTVPLYKDPETEATRHRRELESICFPHGNAVSLKTSSERTTLPPEANTEEAHHSVNTETAVKILSDFGKAPSIFEQRGFGGVYDYVTYLYARTHDVESSGAKLRYTHIMAEMIQALRDIDTKFDELNGFMTDTERLDPHERLQLMLMQVMSLWHQLDEDRAQDKAAAVFTAVTSEDTAPTSPPADDTTSTVAESVSFVDSGYEPNSEQIATYVHPNDVITPVLEMTQTERWTAACAELNKCADDLQKVAIKRADIHEIQSQALRESALDGEKPTYESMGAEDMGKSKSQNAIDHCKSCLKGLNAIETQAYKQIMSIVEQMYGTHTEGVKTRPHWRLSGMTNSPFRTVSWARKTH